MRMHTSVLVSLVSAIYARSSHVVRQDAHHGMQYHDRVGNSKIADGKAPSSHINLPPLDGHLQVSNSVRAFVALLLKAEDPAAGWHVGRYGQTLPNSNCDKNRHKSYVERREATFTKWNDQFHDCLSCKEADRIGANVRMQTQKYGAGNSYWNDRYANSPPEFEWVTTTEEQYYELQDSIQALAGGDREIKILHVGCGNSKLTESLYDRGYHNIANIDTSDVVISQMQKRNENRPGMTWATMDATNLEYGNDSFDLVIEKGLMDTLQCMSNARPVMTMYLEEVMRVLRPGGIFLCSTFTPPGLRENVFSLADLNLSYELVKPEHAFIVRK